MSKATLYLRKVTIDEEPELVAKIGKFFSTDFGTNGFMLRDSKIIGQHFFALQNDKGALYAAASGKIDEKDPSVFKLFNILVDNDSRGVGIGKWFLEQLERKFKDIIKENKNELRKMRVRVIPGNNSSEFYEKSGYENEDGYEWPLFKSVQIK
ncbi:MAG: GNAT family N-acetyltransferase [Alteromonadaceae bacterium]|nr:GNAT family N-acetyltransferase [Alteromonadaceae bacterium]